MKTAPVTIIRVYVAMGYGYVAMGYGYVAMGYGYACGYDLGYGYDKRHVEMTVVKTS